MTFFNAIMTGSGREKRDERKSDENARSFFTARYGSEERQTKIRFIKSGLYVHNYFSTTQQHAERTFRQRRVIIVRYVPSLYFCSGEFFFALYLMSAFANWSGQDVPLLQMIP